MTWHDAARSWGRYFADWAVSLAFLAANLGLAIPFAWAALRLLWALLDLVPDVGPLPRTY